jgi:phosphate transport system substrate-binding protein
VLGLDGIAIIVNKKNPSDATTMGTLARMFAGDDTKWTGDAASLGDIALFARDARSGTNDTFASIVLGGKPMANAVRAYDNAWLADQVARTPNAIGFVPMGAVGDAKALALGDDATSPAVPSPFNVATEAYPLARRIYLYTTTATTHPLAKELVAFALSAEGQRAVAAAGFVDLSVRRRPAGPCSKECPARYATLTSGAERLSIDFRFKSGSAELDTRAREDVLRLAAFAHENPGAKIGLFGFADSPGRDDVSLEVSRTRAEAVATALKAQGLAPNAVDGFGEALPVATNATPAGREHNRRVEAWLLH